MPRKRKIKPHEQKIAEEFFPVDAGDLKRATEKIVKEITAQNIIKEVKKTAETIEKDITKILKKQKNSIKKKEKEIKKKEKEFSVPKISIKERGYELIITEKPQAALKIASALGKANQRNFKGVPYYEVERDGKRIVVACAVGHLFTLKENNPSPKLPTFDISWIPNYLALKKDFTKKYYEALTKIVKDAGSITIATDYDIEGEVI